MLAIPALRPATLFQRLGRLTVIGLGVGSLLGGVTVLAGVTPAGASTNLYVASNGSDASNCHNANAPCLTLQRAYDVAASGDTIIIGGGTFAGDFGVPVSPGLRGITKNLNFVGITSAGSLDVTTTTISGEGGLTAMYLDGSTVNITNVVVDDAIEFSIYAKGNVTLTNVNVGPTSSVPAVTAGVANAGTTFVMNGGSITGTTTTQYGGFVNNHGTATLHDVTLTHNTANGPKGEGGAIANGPISTLHLTGSTAIHNNSATVNAGGILECPGGTVTVGGGVSVTANTPNNISSLDPAVDC